MRVLLVNPYNVGKFGLQNVFQAEPLGLEIIGTAIADDHDVRIQDLRWEPDLVATLRTWKPQVVGISCLYASHTRATWEIARRVKAELPDAHVIAGGQPPSLAPQFFASPDIDSIGLGDGELLMPELLAALERDRPLGQVAGLVLNTPSGQRWTESRPPTRTLSAAPQPRRSLTGIDRRRHYLSFSRPIALMEVTRGCPYRCNFCSIWKFAEAKVKWKAIDQVVAELASLDEDAVFFVDDHFFANPGFMLELGRAIADAALGKTFNVQTRADAIVRHPELLPVWHRAGLHAAFLGLEGHTEGRLAAVNKTLRLEENELAVQQLREHGIGVVGNLMVDPAFSRDQFARLRDYVARHELFFAAYCIATPLPGTDLWNERRHEVDTLDFDLYDIQHAVTKTRLPRDEFYAEYARCWQLRRELQPPAALSYKIKRALRVVFREGLNFELLKNVRRFDRVVCQPEAYLEDHRPRHIPWLDEAISVEENFGNLHRSTG